MAAAQFHRALKLAGRPQITLYGLRHTAATNLLMAGESAKVVAELLGHASVAITLDTYSHVSPGLRVRAMESMDRYLAGA